MIQTGISMTIRETKIIVGVKAVKRMIAIIKRFL